jgi:hypothetical protein
MCGYLTALKASFWIADGLSHALPLASRARLVASSGSIGQVGSEGSGGDDSHTVVAFAVHDGLDCLVLIVRCHARHCIASHGIVKGVRSGSDTPLDIARQRDTVQCMNSTDAQMENVTFRAPRELITALETHAHSEDRDRSYIIRRVLREYLEAQPTEKP